MPGNCGEDRYCGNLCDRRGINQNRERRRRGKDEYVERFGDETGYKTAVQQPPAHRRCGRGITPVRARITFSIEWQHPERNPYDDVHEKSDEPEMRVLDGDDLGDADAGVVREREDRAAEEG